MRSRDEGLSQARRLRVKGGNTRCEQMFSAVPPIADIQQGSRLVRFKERHRLDHDPSAQVAGIVN
jgi:hypothetical protein